MSLWHALLQGMGWRVGREVAEDLISSVKEQAPPPAPAPETAAQRSRRLADQTARAAELVREAEKKAERERKAIDRELAELKKRVR